MEGESLALVLLAAAKWITYLGLFGLTGAVACRGLLPAAFLRDPSGRVAERPLVVIVGGAAVLLVLGAAARLYAQTWSVFGLDEPVTAELMRVIAVDSRWGDVVAAAGRLRGYRRRGRGLLGMADARRLVDDRGRGGRRLGHPSPDRPRDELRDPSCPGSRRQSMGSVRDCGSGRWRWWLRFRSVSCVIRVATRASASSWAGSRRWRLPRS